MLKQPITITVKSQLNHNYS